MKFKCPKCETVLTEKVPKCPKCGTKFNWGQAQTKTVQKRDSTSDTLLKCFYWFKTLTLICPIFGIVVCVLNKGYATCIKRDKQHYYALFKRHTIVSCVLWLILVVLIAVVCAMNYNKQ